VRLVNCARGGIIDEQALAEAIKAGQVAGAAIDVFENEPPKDHPLLKLPQVVATPHLGASTEEAQVNVAVEIARQMADALLGRGIRNAINVFSMDAETLKIIEPYIRLGEKLGLLMAQLAPGHIGEVKVTYIGDVTHHETAPITVAIIKGLLTPIVGESVNYVNASLIAAERGIKIIEAKSSEAKDYANLVAVDVLTNQGRTAVEGTLFTRTDARIVKIDRYHVDVIPEGYLLIATNLDRPGIIGHIGTILGEAKINIAGMTFGREEKGGAAVTVLNVDSAVPKPVLERIKTAPHIQDVKLVKL